MNSRSEAHTRLASHHIWYHSKTAYVLPMEQARVRLRRIPQVFSALRRPVPLSSKPPGGVLMKRYGLNLAVSLGLLFFATAAANAQCATSVPDEWFIQGDSFQVVNPVVTTAGPAVVTTTPVAVTTGVLPANTCAPKVITTAAACVPFTGPHGIFGLQGQPMVTFCGNNPIVGSTLKLYGTPEQYFKAADLKKAAFVPSGTLITNSVLYTEF
jgi:hypothetical protein